MKNILLLAQDFASSDRLVEAVRVASGLSQNPNLQVSLKLPSSPAPSLPAIFQEHFNLFAEKGHRVYASTGWLPLLPAAGHKMIQDPAQKIPTSDFDLFIPF